MWYIASSTEAWKKLIATKYKYFIYADKIFSFNFLFVIYIYYLTEVSTPLAFL